VALSSVIGRKSLHRPQAARRLARDPEFMGAAVVAGRA